MKTAKEWIMWLNGQGEPTGDYIFIREGMLSRLIVAAQADALESAAGMLEQTYIDELNTTATASAEAVRRLKR